MVRPITIKPATAEDAVAIARIHVRTWQVAYAGIVPADSCSLLGPTRPNRLYWMTGTVDGDGKNGGPVIGNNIPQPGYRWTTYAERLEQAGISWKAYHQEFDCGFEVKRRLKL